MSSRYTNIDDDNPSIVISKARNSRIENLSAVTYPSDGDNMPAQTKIVIQEYSRQNPASTPADLRIATIILPLPQQLIDSLSVNTDGNDLGALGGLVVDNVSPLMNMNMESLISGGVSSIVSGISALYKFNPNTVNGREYMSAALQALIPSSTDLGIGAATGVIPNPHTTALFTGVNLRQFNFAWKFSPRTADESRRLRQIIRLLQRAQRPSRGNREFIMDYPYECLVSFKPDVMQVNRSFIKNLTVNYSSSGQPSFYEDLSPTDVDLAIEFIELEAGTRDMVKF